MTQTDTDLVRRALRAAEEFIVNGTELGFIRMPDASTPDPAHDTLPLVRAALAAVDALSRRAARAEEGYTTILKNRDAVAHGEKVALQMAAVKKARADRLETLLREAEGYVVRCTHDKDGFDEMARDFLKQVLRELGERRDAT